MLGLLLATFRFLEFFPLKLCYFWTKSRKKYMGVFFHSIWANNLNFGAKNNGRTKWATLEPEVVALLIPI